MEVKVEKTENDVIVRTPYVTDFVKELKSRIPYFERKFENGKWYVKRNETNEATVSALVSKYFEGLKNHVLVAVCNGKSPAVNGMKLVDYGRDFHRARKTCLFSPMWIVRCGDHGSRNYPRFYGAVAFHVLVNEFTKVDAWKFWLLPHDRRLVEKVITLKEKVEGASEVEEIAEIIGDELSKVESLPLTTLDVVQRLDALITLYERENLKQHLSQLRNALSERVKKLDEILEKL